MLARCCEPNGLSKAISGLPGAKWGGETPKLNSEGGMTGSRRKERFFDLSRKGAGGMGGVWATLGVTSGAATWQSGGIANAGGFLPGRGGRVPGNSMVVPLTEVEDRSCDGDSEVLERLSRRCFMLMFLEFDSRLSFLECLGE